MSTQDIKLSIKIHNNKSFDLNELTASLNALANEYDDYCNKELSLPKNERRLEIVKLEQGSLLIELIPSVIPLIQEMNAVFCFGKYFNDTINFFTGKSKEKEPPRLINKRNCDNINTFLNQTANDNGSTVDINVVGNNNTIILQNKIDSLESNAAQNSISKYKEKLLEEEPLTKHKQAFYWESASFNANKKDSADKGIIEDLDKKSHKVIFDNEGDKELMTTFNEQYKKDWQNLLYIVDVWVIKIQDVIKSYKILKVYKEDTIDPEES